MIWLPASVGKKMLIFVENIYVDTLYGGVWLLVKKWKLMYYFQVKIIGVGWKYLCLRSLTSLSFVTEERLQ